MTVSANTLFHFTDSISAIKGILEDNFHIHFCKETIILEDKPVVYYVPMVSFCDLALSEIKNHVKNYGEYGIGLTKEWGIKNGLNPVMYVSIGSKLAISVKGANNHFARGKLNEMTEEQLNLVNIKRYIKNYEGHLKRGGRDYGVYRFYDEREWRYTPDGTAYKNLIATEGYYTENKSHCDDKLQAARLIFEPSDIKYIILKDDSEISQIISHLRDVKGRKFSLHEIEKLTTRIITSDQIFTDI